jgi:hypothetical protein
MSEAIISVEHLGKRYRIRHHPFFGLALGARLG